MENLNIESLYKFKKQDFHNSFFFVTYSLVGRSGQYGVIDQLYAIYHTCMLGLHATGEPGEGMFDAYFIFSKIKGNKAYAKGMVHNTISFDMLTGNLFVSDEPPSILDTNSEGLDLYFLGNKWMPGGHESHDFNEQQILFQEKSEKISEEKIDVEPAFLKQTYAGSTFFDLRGRLSDDSLKKVIAYNMR